VQNLVREHGEEPLEAVRRVYPRLAPIRYKAADLDLERVLEGVDAVLVHEWNDHAIVKRLGQVRARGAPFVLLFHDTHHRCITEPDAMAAYDLSGYDGVLAFGQVLRNVYLERSLIDRAFVWHEAADVEVFRPLSQIGARPSRDVVFIGNWGDDERRDELTEYLLSPVSELGLSATVHGVRYPPQAVRELERAGARYAGWLPNFEAPRAYAEHRITIHVPRRPYARALPGIPTIRVFEALACGIALVSAPWDDAERLFAGGEDYLVAETGAAMKRHLALLASDPPFARALGEHGRRTVLSRHTCAHRVDELLSILAELGAPGAPATEPTRRAS
jgi:spore maturation protein CgeB